MNFIKSFSIIVVSGLILTGCGPTKSVSFTQINPINAETVHLAQLDATVVALFPASAPEKTEPLEELDVKRPMIWKSIYPIVRQIKHMTSSWSLPATRSPTSLIIFQILGITGSTAIP